MKISFWIPHARLSGGNRATITYAHTLRRFGHEVEVVVESVVWYRRLIANLFGILPAWMKGQYDVTLRRTGSFLHPENLKTDSIVADSFQAAGKLIASGAGPRKIHFIQHDERLYHGDPDKVSSVYASALAKVVVSTWLKDMLKRDFGADAEYIKYGLDRDLFHPVPRKRGNEIRILVLDHNYDWKGTREAVEAVKRVKQNHPEVVLVGFGVRRKDPAMPYDEYHYDIPQKRLASLYSSADIYCCTSWKEGFGMPSLEAMACGSALVTYDNGGSRDFAVNEVNALVVPERDERALASALGRLVSDRALLERLKEEALATANAWPTWEREGRLFEKAILDPK